ncbi:MAG: PKD domain-containing protein [Flavobacteriales bacterium]|nr:PKD domain-containing protein [Flavobacteriales bacterium]
MIRQFTSVAFIVTIMAFASGCKQETKNYAADFEASMTNIGVGQAVNFEDNSIGAVTAWEWSFDGGTPSTASVKDPDGILYTEAGTYDVTLTITTDAGKSTETKTGYIVVTVPDGGCGDLTTVTDIDGNVYSVVTIGTQCWMGENLKTSHYRDGSAIAEVSDSTQWKYLQTGAYCFYKNDNSFEATYGKLYNWYAINDSSGICPDGWHVPQDSEFKTLVDYLGASDGVAGGRLKEDGTTHWEDPNTGGSNTSGWTGLPGGMRYREGQFDQEGRNGLFWSARRESESLAYFLTLTYNSEDAFRTYIYKQSGFSCRCVKD